MFSKIKYQKIKEALFEQCFKNNFFLISRPIINICHGDLARLYYCMQLVASLLGVESGQDAVIRALLYKRESEFVQPYNITVAEFTRGISNLRNQLGMSGVKDEGVIVVDPQSGAENKTDSNILSADANSLSYARQPQEILRIVYGTGNESQPGGFLPKGGIGNIAQGYLNS